MQKVLVIEDDRSIADLIALHLGENGFEVALASDGVRGLELASTRSYDLIILDLVLPGRGGIEICKTLRAQSIHTPIMMLTTRGDEVDKVLGLELGADDYVTKPFGIRELIARVKALCRRVRDPLEAQELPIEYDGLSINPSSRHVTLSGNPIDLTSTEFDLLLYMAKHPGRAFTREQLLNNVWGYTSAAYEHTVNTHINRLRSKIEESPTAPRFIQTVWGVGYRFSADTHPAPSERL